MTTQPTVTPAAFVEKWRGVTTTEKASSQSHFIDLCRPASTDVSARDASR